MWRHLRRESTALAACVPLLPSTARMPEALGLPCLFFRSVKQSVAAVSLLVQVQQDKGMPHNCEKKREEHTTLDCTEQ